jgi:hypothetical protein
VKVLTTEADDAESPSPKFQVRLVTVPVEVSVKATVKGAVPLVGLAVKLATGSWVVGACTVSVVLPTLSSRVAVILVLPAPRLVASPALTLATFGREESQFAWLLTSWVLPSEYVAVAVKRCVSPISMVGLVGATATVFTVGVGMMVLTSSENPL